MAFNNGGGGNPRWGRDSGPPPPTHAAYGGQHFQGMGRMSMPMPVPMHMPMHGFHGYHTPQYQPQAQYGYQQPAAAGGFVYPPGGYAGAGVGTRPPNAYPNINPTMPAANLTNSTGGVGCEPGYNYFFPAEHTKIIVLQSGSTPPWQIPPRTQIPLLASHVPCNTTIGSLLKGFGATNPIFKKNKVVECVQAGDGRWYSGMGFSGDNSDDTDKTIGSVGWDKTRTGFRGQKPPVFLYITKD